MLGVIAALLLLLTPALVPVVGIMALEIGGAASGLLSASAWIFLGVVAIVLGARVESGDGAVRSAAG